MELWCRYWRLEVEERELDRSGESDSFLDFFTQPATNYTTVTNTTHAEYMA